MGPEILLHSVMTKRSQGQSTFGRINFKKRLFILTSKSLTYNTGNDLDSPGTNKGEILIQNIQTVEEVNSDVFIDQSGFSFQIVHSDTGNSSHRLILYIISGLKKVREDWIAHLRQLISVNTCLQPMFHPGMFGSCKAWSCCGALSSESTGCRNSFYHKDEVEKRKASIKSETMTVIAIYDLTAQQPNTDLNLCRGEKLDVLDSSDQHWWRARNKAGQVGMIPESYVRRDGMECREWYHAEIESRHVAEMMLKDHNRDCTFLVRPSARGKVKFSISLFYMNTVKHYHIQQADGFFWVNEKNKYPSVDQLVEYHKLNSAGMACRLRFPLPKNDTPPLVGNPFGQYLIDPNEVQIESKLGSGQFGVVYKGRWKNYTVAVKTMIEGCMAEDDFFDEAKIMMNFKHPNLIRFHGISNKQPIYILTEFMVHGSLNEYLQKHPNISAQTPVVLDICTQIASAMKYLEEHKFIHRDLATRNCLVGHQQVIKVADFGLSRFVTDDEYTASEGAKFPVKWSSPEVIDYGKYSSKSDVWSYGVTMWETLSGGQTPYREYTNHQVIELIQRGHMLPIPHTSTPKLTEIMEGCWIHKLEDRITFDEILDRLHGLNFEVC